MTAHKTWLGEYVIVDGYVIEYEITDPGEKPITSGPPDNWTPGSGPSWEVTDISDDETGEAATYEDLQEEWGMTEEQVMEHIDHYIELDLEGARHGF